jgi:prevent-host-death family protein
MRTVGLSEAKKYFDELLKRVSRGETIYIARLGVTVAKLIPVEEPKQKDLRRIVREIREIRRGARLDGLTIRELIHEGRHH